MKLNIIEDLDQNNLILEGTRYDKQASKILSDSGLFDPETADAIIDGLFKNDIHAFVHSPNWLEKYLKGIARMCVEESKGDKNKAVKFLNDSPQVFDKYLTWVKENREKYGTKLDDDFNNKLSYKDVVDFLDKIQAELDKKSEEELANMNFSSSNYELIPIDSFEQFNSLFGGKATGDGSSDKYAGGGGTAWCHANSESTYNSSSWAGNPRHKFYVLANKDWKNIKFDPQSNSNNPKDDYGNSLIAILVDTRTGRLLNATLRCNHVGVSSNADNQYKTYSELSKIAGFNVRDAIRSDLDLLIDPNMSVKDVWYKYFDGTYGSVSNICEILDTSREDITEAYIPNNITSIGFRAFINCKSLASITIPNNVTAIGDNAFFNCKSLTSIIITDNVTSIGYNAFYGCKSLTNITIGNEVTRIDQSAFEGCTSLTSITIPDNVTSIGSYAFDGCTSLTSITIPNSITTISDGTFVNCKSLKSITIPNSVTNIGSYAFDNCTSLKNVTIPNSVIRIRDFAFVDCSSLANITIPNSVTKIGTSAFYDCTSLKSITIPNGVTEIGKGAFYGCRSLTVTTNNPYAIEYCENNNIPVKTLKESLFNSKNNLILEGTRYDKQASKILSDSGLFDPETADAIIDGLFKNDIHAFVHSPNWLEKYLKGIARMCVEESNGDRNKAVKFLNDSPQVFDRYLTWVKENRSKYGTKLDDDFNNKLSYKDVVDFLDKIQAELDKKSEEELANMKFKSSNYELVPINSFEQFNSLFGGKATGDGSSDKYAGGGGTAWCHANSESTYDSNSWAGNPYHKFYVLANKDWKNIKFDPQSNSNNPKDNYGNSLIAILVNTKNGRLLNATLRCNHVGVPSNADNQYKTYSELSKIAGFNVKDAIMNDLDILIDSSMSDRDVWYKYFNGTADSVDKICGILDTSREDITEIYISDNIKIIGANAFDSCKSLKSITIPNSVTEIGWSAFYNCTSLTSITIPDSITSINRNTFDSCTSLTSITIPDSVTKISYSAFDSCISLKSITIPNSVTSIGGYAFDSCTSLTSITIPNNVTHIGKFAFYNCSSLTSITIPNSVTSIEHGAFGSCTSLTSITIPDRVTDIGEYAFSGCTLLKRVVIPDSVTNIGEYAFRGCTSLTSITIPNSVTTIEANAFDGCTSLTSVTIGNSVTNIGRHAFKGCTSLKSVTIPDSVTNIYDSVFEYCTSLTITTNNPYIIDYCENNNIPVKTLKESLFNSKNNLILEGTRYDKQASKILSDSGLFDSETADAIIDGLFKNDIHAFVHSPNWLEKYLKGIARMCVEESKGDKNKAVKFLNDSPQVFDKYLTWVKENREKYGTKLDDDFNNKLSYKDVVDFLDKIQAELDKKSEEELANMNFSSSNYELVPIDSFEQFNSLFGGKATGDGSSNKYAGGGGTAWCHANSESTYNLSSWAGNPYHKFYVLANKDWKKIKFDAESNSNNPKDDYGNSLIALLVDTRTGRLLNATLRCNHVGVSSNADNQYKTYSELSRIAGFNVRDAVKSDLDIPIDPNMSVKDVWYKYFDGTYGSVSNICEILDTSREDITEVYISDNIKIIQNDAFAGCKSLISVTIPNSVTEIDDYAFDYCISLTSVTIPDSVTIIGDFAFWECTSLKNITIPDHVTLIGSGAFYNCNSLTNITIPNSVTHISNGAFWGCTSLKSVTIPNSVTTIGNSTFRGCTSLTITTNNPYVIEYCENNNIPVKTLKESLFNSKNKNENFRGSKMSKYLEVLCESVMTPTPTPYTPDLDVSTHPTYILVVFNKDKESLLSPRGSIVTTFASQGDLDNYANNLYDLIRDAFEVYSIIPELYSQAITKFKSNKDFYDYIHDNGILHKRVEDMSNEEAIYSDIIDADTDFNI